MNVSEKDRQWFNEAFAKASQLESRLIPDILDGKVGPCGKALFPVSIPQKQWNTVRKRMGCPDETLLETAFGLTLSVWTGDTKACFSAVRENIPEHPVFVEWAAGQPLSSLTEAVEISKIQSLIKINIINIADVLKILVEQLRAAVHTYSDIAE